MTAPSCQHHTCLSCGPLPCCLSGTCWTRLDKCACWYARDAQHCAASATTPIEFKCVYIVSHDEDPGCSGPLGSCVAHTYAQNNHRPGRACHWLFSTYRGIDGCKHAQLQSMKSAGLFVDSYRPTYASAKQPKWLKLGVISGRWSKLDERGNTAAQTVCRQLLRDQCLPSYRAPLPSVVCEGEEPAGNAEWDSADLAVQGSDRACTPLQRVILLLCM